MKSRRATISPPQPHHEQFRQTDATRRTQPGIQQQKETYNAYNQSKPVTAKEFARQYKERTGGHGELNGMQRPIVINELLDISASIAGGPMDPRSYSQSNSNPKFGERFLSLRQYQNFVQAAASYRHQMEAMANVTDTFVRALNELAECIPTATIQDQQLISDFKYLTDITQVVANTHIACANRFEQEVEEPLTDLIQEIAQESKARRSENRRRMQQLDEKLHEESQRLTSHRSDLSMNRMSQFGTDGSVELCRSLEDAIARLAVENETVFNDLTHGRVESVLQVMSQAIAPQVELHENILEGCSKIVRQDCGAADSECSLSTSINQKQPYTPLQPDSKQLPHKPDSKPERLSRAVAVSHKPSLLKPFHHPSAAPMTPNDSIIDAYDHTFTNNE